MILKERLKSVPGNEFLYLGTDKGHSWLWICQNKDLNKSLDELNLCYRSEAERNLAQQKLHENKTRKQIAKGHFATKFDLPNLTKELENVQVRVNYWQQYLVDWKNLQDRGITEEFLHESAPRGLAIKVTGNEVGAYWTFSEVGANVEVGRNVSRNSYWYKCAS